MASFWLTFRIHHNRTYDQRYQALMDHLANAGAEFWEEPTSFIAFTADHTIDALGQYLKNAIDETVDVFVLREIGKDNTRYAGTFANPRTFPLHFPAAKKL
jgi:hypothetical protein